MSFTILPVLTSLFLYFCAIVIHEFAHIAYYNKITGKPLRVFFFYKKPINFGIKVGREIDYETLTSKQYVTMQLYGIFCGMIPIILYSVLDDPFYLIVLLMYLPGCIPDVKSIKGVFRP